MTSRPERPRSLAWSTLPPGESRRDADVEAAVRALCDPDVLLSAFQPVFRASTGDLEGCEALLRLPPNGPFRGPYDAFEAALATGLGAELEAAATLRTLRDAEPYTGGLRLFLNLLAPVFHDSRYDAAWLVDQVLAAGRIPSQVILEIPEISRISDYVEFGRAIEPYRTAGFRIAIDDFGAGYTNLRMITDLSPDFVKVDRVFVDGISAHARKRILVESVVALCHRINCGVIAEGIEKPEDLDAVLAAGVDFLQGYLLARPAPAEEAFVVEDLALKAHPYRLSAADLRHLLDSSATMDASDPASAALQRFSAEPGLQDVLVLLKERPIGLLTRQAAAAWLATGAGTTSVSLASVVEDTPLDEVPETSSLEEVVDVVSRRPAARRFAPIVVTGPGKVVRGLLRLDALLEEVVRRHAESFLHVNPLTRLPARHEMEEVLAGRLREGASVELARVNLRRFRSFNDRYGFLRGDKLLTAVAGLLREELARVPHSFLAHYDGDDFAFLAAAGSGEGVVRRLSDRLAALVSEHYDPEDVAAGGIVGHDRQGAPVTIAPVEVAAGVVRVDGHDGLGVRDVTELAQQAVEAARKGPEKVVTYGIGAAGSRSLPPITQVRLQRPRLP